MMICLICKTEFTLKTNLTQHLNKNRCKIKNCKTLYDEIEKLHNKINELQTNVNVTNITNEKTPLNKVVISGTNNTIQNVIQNVIPININIHINPISKLSIDHIKSDKMKTLLETYNDGDRSSSNLNVLLKDYIKDVICDKAHPENHSVKYIKKKPPTYNSIIEKNGTTVTVINGLKDTCDLLSDPVLDILKTKLKEFIKKTKNYKVDENNSYRDWYGDTMKILRDELTKGAVKKALSSVLQHDILNDIEMKLTISENNNDKLIE